LNTKQLAVSPQPRVAGEAITTTIGSQLAVKVEGIVQVLLPARDILDGEYECRSNDNSIESC
jgi:hypothetical protein